MKDGNERKERQIVARQVRMLSPALNGNDSRSETNHATQQLQPSEEGNPFRDAETDSDIPF